MDRAEYIHITNKPRTTVITKIRIILSSFMPGTIYKNKKLTPVVDTVFINLVLASECSFHVYQ